MSNSIKKVYIKYYEVNNFKFEWLLELILKGRLGIKKKM